MVGAQSSPPVGVPTTAVIDSKGPKDAHAHVVELKSPPPVDTPSTGANESPQTSETTHEKTVANDGTALPKGRRTRYPDFPILLKTQNNLERAGVYIGP